MAHLNALRLALVLLTSSIQVVNAYQQLCDQQSNFCYHVINLQKDWVQALDYCGTTYLGGSLASIRNAFNSALLQALTTQVLPSSNTWLGGYHFASGSYQWSDEAAFGYANWAPGRIVCSYSFFSKGYPVNLFYLGQPSNLTDQCIQLCTDVSNNRCVYSKWYTVRCSEQGLFICQSLQKSDLPCPGCTDCMDWYNAGHQESGVFTLSPVSPGLQPFQAYCDMDTDGGGWTVFQRRIDNSIPFWNRTWLEYKYGFNNGLTQNFWLGNDILHVLSTKDPIVHLRVDVWGDRAPASQYSGGSLFGEHVFSIGDEESRYMMHISPQFSGNATSDPNNTASGIIYNNGVGFSTIDDDHSVNSTCTNGDYQLGAWWLRDCTVVALNGMYTPKMWSSQYGFTWCTGVYCVNPAHSEMKLRKLLA